MRDEPDVIVIGAGLAGLTAARELGHAGRRVLLLEARDRLGGRAYTSHLGASDVELGGAFVHWFQPHVFAELTRYGLTFRVPPEPTRFSYVSQGRRHDSTLADLVPRMEEAFARLFVDTRATMPLPHQPLAVAEAVSAVDHLSVQDRIDASDLTPEERDLVNAVLSTSCSARCSEGALTAMMRWYALSGWSFGLMLDAVGIFPMRTADLVQALLADGAPEVRTSTPVAAIVQHDDRVRVRSRAGEEFTGSAAVVAVPLNTLGAVEFTPSLDPAKKDAASRGQASHGVKLWARVDGVPEPVFVMAPDSEPLTFLGTEEVFDDGGQLLVAFGPDATRVPPGDEDAVRRAFAELLPPTARIAAVTGHDWCTDEFARGTWSVFRPGQLTGSLSSLQAPHGRVVLAGADLANGWNGFLDGAIESGLTAARWVSRLLRGERTGGEGEPAPSPRRPLTAAR
ncbi:MAG TPA: NAD(P)/FAD-dependent oxidoreductase [Geodermatophilus sp.]|nr:NAD(P)/FAD-dependent oxidoreductase [Geodermatophilus sp.]